VSEVDQILSKREQIISRIFKQGKFHSVIINVVVEFDQEVTSAIRLKLNRLLNECTWLLLVKTMSITKIIKKNILTEIIARGLEL
jgi:hypothetical protein